MSSRNTCVSTNVLCVALAAVLLSGCATKPQLMRAEWLAATTRFYPNQTVDEVLVAAEEVLMLADEDFELVHGPNDLYAARP